MRKSFAAVLAAGLCGIVYVIPEGACESAPELLAKAKQAFTAVESLKLKGKTITGSIDTTYEEGSVDYARRRFFGIDRKESVVLSSIYHENGSTYVHDNATDSWVSFDEALDPGSVIFNKDQIFSTFPDAASENGFTITFAGEDTVENDPCYRIQAAIYDQNLAKGYVQRALENFVPPQIAVLLRQDEQMLHDYLEAYTSGLRSSLWISKDSFLIRQLKTEYRQVTGPDESIPIERQIIYCDFNSPVIFELPEQAMNANKVTAQDLGLSQGQ